MEPAPTVYGRATVGQRLYPQWSEPQGMIRGINIDNRMYICVPDLITAMRNAGQGEMAQWLEGLSRTDA